MEPVSIHSDSLGILASTAKVMSHAQSVSINEKNFEKIAQPISDCFKRGVHFHQAESLSEEGVQLLFVEDTVNFCFWAGKDEPRWQVRTQDGKLTTGGWYGLEAALKRALQNGIPLLDAHYLSSLSEKDGAQLFRGEGGILIPLLQERIKNLREAGMVLQENFDGQFANLLKLANDDAVQLVKLTAEHFSSFRDVSVLDGSDVFFYKRAQILAKDISYLFEAEKKKLKNIEELTAFADYKLPQILRMYGVIEYERSLADRIDNYIEIPHGSREEIEIRAASVQAVEQLRTYLPALTAADIDNTLWLMSQSIQAQAQPYHRTRTIFY